MGVFLSVLGEIGNGRQTPAAAVHRPRNLVELPVTSKRINPPTSVKFPGNAPTTKIQRALSRHNSYVNGSLCSGPGWTRRTTRGTRSERPGNEDGTIPSGRPEVRGGVGSYRSNLRFYSIMFVDFFCLVLQTVSNGSKFCFNNPHFKYFSKNRKWEFLKLYLVEL